MYKVTAKQAASKLRLDAFLAAQIAAELAAAATASPSGAQDVSRAKIQASIAAGLVSLNGRPAAKASQALRAGDCVVCALPPPPPLQAAPEPIPLEIKYEDEHLIVINKPAGMVVHVAPGHYSGTLVNALLHHCTLPPLDLEPTAPGGVAAAAAAASYGDDDDGGSGGGGDVLSLDDDDDGDVVNDDDDDDDGEAGATSGGGDGWGDGAGGWGAGGGGGAREQQGKDGAAASAAAAERARSGLDASVSGRASRSWGGGGGGALAGLPDGVSVDRGRGSNIALAVGRGGALAAGGGSGGGGGAILRPGIVHRLDKGTSGLLVVAKSETALTRLQAQFKARTVDRMYVSITVGCPDQQRGRVEANIVRDPRDRKRMAAAPYGSGRGRTAASGYSVESRLAGGGAALVRWKLDTGRTHQIRVHAKHIGHPLFGDETYGGSGPAAVTAVARSFDHEQVRQSLAVLNRPALHALTLGFSHPITGRRLDFAQPPPEDFTQALRLLGGGDPAW